MQAIIEEVIDKYHTRDGTEHITERRTITGETEEELFKAAYPFQRSLRYCNGYSIRFQDAELNKKWKTWQHTGVTLQMYYGNATVD